ncbi:phosphotransferase family protein [Paraburkholderia jirisanensis]
MMEGAVKSGEQIDVAAITQWLRRQGQPMHGEPRLTQYHNGLSCRTYRLRFINRDMVLRFPLHAGALRQMRREYQLQHFLAGSFPVPAMFALCDNLDVAGVPFYAMQHVSGINIDRSSAAPGRFTAAQNRLLCIRMLERVIELHRLPLEPLLPVFGEHRVACAAALVRYWYRRYLRFATGDTPALDDVYAWLIAHAPAPTPRCLTHNDWKFDNIVFSDDDELRVLGVLDWESAAPGDPLIDLALLLALWPQADDAAIFRRYLYQPVLAPGMLSRAEILAFYAQHGPYPIAQWGYYEVLGLFYYATVAQFLHARHLAGRDGGDPFFAGVPALLEHVRQRCVAKIDAYGALTPC